MTRKTNVATKTTRVAKIIETPTIALKTIHDAIIRDNPTSTLTTKKMRVKLRATPAMREIHVHQMSWLFTTTRANEIRAMFDATFAKREHERVARETKRNAKSNDAPRAKRVVKTNVANVAQIDATTNDVEA